MRNRRTLPLLTAVVALCFAGLMTVQVIWINKVIEANKTIFRSRVESVLKNAANNFRQASEHKEGLSYAVNTNEDSTIEKVNQELVCCIKDAFIKDNLNLDFQYAVYAHCDDSTGNGLAYSFGSQFSDKLPICAQSFDKESKSYQVPLTCSIIPDNPFHLAVVLPDQNKYLLASLIDSLIASILFTLALISLFVYFLYMVYRQKKLAHIKDDFINNLTHEFKTPLFSIGLAAGLLKKNEHIKSETHLDKYVTLIQTEKARLESQVNKILQMAMVDSGNFVLEKRSFDLHELISNVIADFGLAIQDKSGEVVMDLDARNPVIIADEMHIKNVIFNLLDNAVKYSKATPIIQIKTENIIDENKNWISIIVKDNGIGMNQEVMKNVFSKFYRGHQGDIHDVKGFGLGMSYVKSIVEMHKGNIKVESDPGSGSSFHIKLPIA